MQFYALDRSDKLVFAKSARRQVNYLCPECRSVVRLRGGLHRQDHFYHIEAERDCRQNGKSAEHLNIQYYFLKALPEGECCLEQRFPSISRIADVVWVPQKIVFEIQCSPISAAEISERNRDYGSVGYKVVWILHDKRYNQKRLSGAEFYLQFSPHYFSNISERGEGIIYDQFTLVRKGERVRRLKPLPIDIRQLQNREGKRVHQRLNLVERRLEKCPLYFSGDLVDHVYNVNLDRAYVEEAARAELEVAEPIPEKITPLGIAQAWCSKFIVRPYRLLLQLCLERACK